MTNKVLVLTNGNNNCLVLNNGITEIVRLNTMETYLITINGQRINPAKEDGNLADVKTAAEKIDDLQAALKSVDADELITRITDSSGAEINPAKEDGNLSSIEGYLADQSIDKTREQVGSQLLNVDNATSLTAVGKVDLQDAQYHDLSLEVKIEYGGDPGASMNFNLYWVMSGESLSISDAITDIGGSASDGSNWSSLNIGLTSGAVLGDIEYYQSILFSPKARYLYVAYTCDDITNPLSTVDVYLNRS